MDNFQKVLPETHSTRVLSFFAVVMCILAIVFSLYARVPTHAGERDSTPQSAIPWDGRIGKGVSGGDGSKDSPYLIATAAQLAFLAQVINGNDDHKGRFRTIHCKLTAGISEA